MTQIILTRQEARDLLDRLLEIEGIEGRLEDLTDALDTAQGNADEKGKQETVEIIINGHPL